MEAAPAFGYTLDYWVDGALIPAGKIPKDIMDDMLDAINRVRSSLTVVTCGSHRTPVLLVSVNYFTDHMAVGVACCCEEFATSLEDQLADPRYRCKWLRLGT